MSDKIWSVEDIKTLLDNNDVALERAILRIYDFQTNTEKGMLATTDANGVGFNAFDADFLTKIAQWIQRSVNKEGTRLTPKQLIVSRKKMKKYSKQLSMVANGEI